MIPKFNARRIGEVAIFELQGAFTNPWVNRIKDEMIETMNEEEAKGLLFNVRETEKVDDPGALAILQMVRQAPKGGIWGHNLTAYFIAEHMNPQEPIPIFEKGTEAVGYFGKEFAGRSRNEKRRFPRVKTALPVELELEDFGDEFLFEGVVTNLSAGGFYAYFLDAASEELARRKLDPYDLKLLKIRLKPDRSRPIETEGKVLRTGRESSVTQGVAVEFYNLKAADGERIREFLKEEEK